MSDYWIVKRYHSGGSSVVSVRYEDIRDAFRHAGELNARYQTDEYRVEKWLS